MNSEGDMEEALKKQSGAYEKIIKVLKKQIDTINGQKTKIADKYQKNKGLLKEANSKILQLIQNKILAKQ